MEAVKRAYPTKRVRWPYGPVTVERHPIRGHLTVTAMIGGRLASHQFYGFTKRAASQEFKRIHTEAQ